MLVSRVDAKREQRHVESGAGACIRWSCAGGRLTARREQPIAVRRPSQRSDAALIREQHDGVAPIAADDVQIDALERASIYRDSQSAWSRHRIAPSARLVCYAPRR